MSPKARPKSADLETQRRLFKPTLRHSKNRQFRLIEVGPALAQAPIVITHRALFILALLASTLAPSVASTQPRERPPPIVSDVWSEPAQGLRYLRRTTSTPSEIHVIVADLRHRGVRVATTSHRDRWGTITERAEASNVEVVVNGGFWSTLQRPCGLAAGDGEVWPNTTADPEFGTFVIDTEGQAQIHPPEFPPEDLTTIAQAVSGRPMLVTGGLIDEPTLLAFPSSNARAPRTSVGLSTDRQTLYVVVVDGRQRASRGMDLYELAQMMSELGAHDAMNLDGGASSQMLVRHLGGIVNVPARGRWEVAVDEMLGTGDATRTSQNGTEVFVRGREQEVINHLGIYAQPFDVPVIGSVDSLGGIVLITLPRPLPPRVRLGVWREILARMATIAVPLIAIILLYVWWRTRRINTFTK